MSGEYSVRACTIEEKKDGSPPYNTRTQEPSFTIVLFGMNNIFQWYDVGLK